MAELKTKVTNASVSAFIGAVEDDSDRLIGFARVLTDRIYKALVLDVLVANDVRGKGFGLQIMDAVMRHPELEDHPDHEGREAQLPSARRARGSAGLGGASHLLR